jgi:hypothetical protein
LGFILLYFSPMLLGGITFNSDGQRSAYAQQLAFWSGDWAAGWPVIADVASMPIYPMRLIMHSLGAPFNAFVVAAYLTGFLGTYLFLERRHDPGPACLGAVSFTLSGWMLTHLGHTSMIHSASWLPWILFGLELTISSKRNENATGLFVIALAMGMSCLAGHLQIVLYSIILAVAYGCFVSFRTVKLKTLAASLVAIGCGIGFASPMLFPALELSSYSFREDLGRQAIFEYSFPALELPSLILPFVYGATPYGWFGQAYVRPEYSGETLTFIPAIVLTLALLSVFTKNQRRTHTIFWSCVLLVSVCFAMGNTIRPLGWVTEHTPILNKFRAHSRHLLEASLALSVLAASGAQALLYKANYAAIIKTILALFLISTLAVVMAIVFIPFLGIPSSGTFLVASSLPIVLAIIFILGAMVTVLCLAHLDCKATLKLSVILFLFILQTTFLGYQLPWFVYAPKDKVTSTEPDWSRDFHTLIGRDYRVLGMDGWQSQIFEPDKSREFSLRTLGWYGPLLNRPIAELSGVTTGGWTRRETLQPFNRVLDILSVRYVGVNNKESATLKENPSRWRFVKIYGDESVFENLRALPRVRVVCELYPIQDATSLLAAIYDENRTPVSLDESALVLGDKGTLLVANTKCQGSAKIESESHDSLRVSAHTLSDAYLVISDSWYPGWKATVNGAPSEILRVNHALRAVKLRHGNNSVELHFVPSKLLLGLIVALLSSFALIFLIRRTFIAATAATAQHGGAFAVPR